MTESFDIPDEKLVNIPSFISITPQGFIFLILSIAVSIFGFRTDAILLFVPGMILPLVFIQFILFFYYRETVRLEFKLILPQTQVKAKTFLPVQIEVQSSEVVTGIVKIETSENLFPVYLPDTTLVDLKKKEKSLNNFLFLAPKRGKETIERIIFQYNGILGLFYITQRYAVRSIITVLPEPQRIQLPWTMKQKIMDRFISSISIPIRGRGSEFLALKDFEFGDEIRHISWKATAKFNKLISKEFEEPRQLRFLLIIDASLFMAGSKLEFALSAAVELSSVIRKSEHSVHILVHGERTYRRIALGTSPSAIRTLAISLHDVVPEGTGFNYQTLFDTVKSHRLYDTVAIIISDCELDPTIVQRGMVMIQQYFQRMFFLICNTPGFGTLAVSKVRDISASQIEQVLYRREIIEPKIFRTYNERIAKYRGMIASDNATTHVIETYETNILLEIQKMLQSETRRSKSMRTGSGSVKVITGVP